MYNTLDRRELGIEFALGECGDIWQFADPIKVDTFDAGYINPRSMGVEKVCYGYRKKVPPRWAWRDTYRTKLHGRSMELADFTELQKLALLALIEAVIESGTTKIERKLPRDAEGNILARKMSRSEMRKLNGVCGHYHVTASKNDPGTSIFDYLDQCGYR
jgi:hypothetical protein